jgi:hypothetical protein
MHACYEDILELAEQLGREPLWWDDNGVPRFAVHHPRHAADIYAEEAALVLICCQDCGRELEVQMTRMLGRPLLSVLVAARTLHYGDPPSHADTEGTFCRAGCTMNCHDLRVLEFWRRDTQLGWVRVSALEVALPDSSDPDVQTLRDAHPGNRHRN